MLQCLLVTVFVIADWLCEKYSHKLNVSFIKVIYLVNYIKNMLVGAAF